MWSIVTDSQLALDAPLPRPDLTVEEVRRIEEPTQEPRASPSHREGHTQLEPALARTPTRGPPHHAR
jgi:hypothetical protein